MTSETRFQYLPAMSDHDLTDTYVYACAVIGHGPEPWVVRALSDWLTAGRAELARRGLLARTERAKGAMWKDHHARTAAAR